MTVRELIDALAGLELDAEVCVPGYEDGWDPIEPGDITEAVLVLRVWGDPYCGKYAEAERHHALDLRRSCVVLGVAR